MFTRSKQTAERRDRSGLVSHFMIGRGDVEGDHLAVTWVDATSDSTTVKGNVAVPIAG